MNSLTFGRYSPYNTFTHKLDPRNKILLLILLIAVDRFTGIINYGELSHIFGIDSWNEVMENDPFSDRTAESTENTIPVIRETT